MNECRHYRMLRIDSELGGPASGGPHCPECENVVRIFVRLLDAGRELARVEPPEEIVKAGRRRLLERLAQHGGGGLVVLLALAGGLLVGGLASSLGGGRRIFATEAFVTAGMGTAAALARGGEGRTSRGVGLRTPRSQARGTRAGTPTRDIMGPCELALASC